MRLEELELAEFALVVEFLHEQEFAGIDHGFHHHVFQSGGLREVDDLLALLHAGRHRHGAGDVLARLQRLDRLPAVIGDRRVDVDGVDLRIGEQVVVGGVAFFDAELVADFVELRLGPLADGGHVRLRVALVDGDELGSEAEPDDCDVY